MNLISSIKRSEGFVGTVYQDSLGIDTVGFGTKMPLDEEEAELLLVHRLEKFQFRLSEAKPNMLELSEERRDVLYEMAYQLGIGGLLKFKKMWAAIEERDFFIASLEMLDSRWAKQTSLRAKRLSNIMRG